MRLILCHGNFGTAKPPLLPQGTFVFACMEEFSVGPLGDWNDRQKFQNSRVDYWHKTSTFDLPNGEKTDYFIWHQVLPRHDLVDLVKSGVAIEDIPTPTYFDDLAPQATSIEIWCDHSVGDCVFLWYLSVVLEEKGIDMSCVSLCLFSDPMIATRSRKFWSDMLLDTAERCIPAVSLSAPEWLQLSNYWKAATELPARINPEMMHKADKQTLHAFEVLMSRHPNPATGLTRIQERLLHSTQEDWLEMVHVVTNAMIAGLDENDQVGDRVLQAEIEEMSRLPLPLVEIDGTGAARFCKVRLTSRGTVKRRTLSAK